MRFSRWPLLLPVLPPCKPKPIPCFTTLALEQKAETPLTRLIRARSHRVATAIYGLQRDRVALSAPEPPLVLRPPAAPCPFNTTLITQVPPRAAPPLIQGSSWALMAISTAQLRPAVRETRALSSSSHPPEPKLPCTVLTPALLHVRPPSSPRPRRSRPVMAILRDDIRHQRWNQRRRGVQANVGGQIFYRLRVPVRHYHGLQPPGALDSRSRLGRSSARIFMRRMSLRLGLLNKRVRRGQSVWFFSWYEWFLSRLEFACGVRNNIQQAGGRFHQSPTYGIPITS